MKTFQDFEKALLNNEEVFVGDGFILVSFYAARRNAVCGLISVCVDVALPACKCDLRYHRSSSVCSSMEAYCTYRSLYEQYNGKA